MPRTRYQDKLELSRAIAKITTEAAPSDVGFVLLVFPRGGEALGPYHSNVSREEAVRKLRLAAREVERHTGKTNGRIPDSTTKPAEPMSTPSAAPRIAPLSLYHLTEELYLIEQALLESGGEITDEMDQQYADLLTMHAEKVEGYVAMIRKFEASAEGIKSERERLQQAEQTMQNAARNLKARLAQTMLVRGETEHRTSLGKVRLQQSGSRPLVLLVEPENLPEEYQRIRVEADKTALKKALKEGQPLTQYAELGEGSYFVRIY